MRINFRQGIVNYQNPTFLSVKRTSVDLIVDKEPLLLTIAFGSKDYLFTEHESVTNAWNRLYTGRDQWLYIDYDSKTLNRTFGITTKSPVVSPTAPLKPLSDQHWFDTTTNQMKVWNGSSWVNRIRIFVAMLNKGTTPSSVSYNTPIFSGTQIGDTSIVYAGAIVYNGATNLPIKDETGVFVTTEDNLRTMDLDVSTLKLANSLIEARAHQNLAAYTIVKFLDFNEINHADGFTAAYDKVYGIIQTDTATGEYVNVVTNGIITNKDWNWTAIGVNAPLYTNDAGQLSTQPYVPLQVRCATVIGKHTILLGAPAQIYNGPTTINPPAPNSLVELSDVVITEVEVGQVLKYDGYNWVNASFGISSSLPNIITAGTATKVTFNSKGLITGAGSLTANDIPNLNWNKITSGLPTTLSGYGITDVYTKLESDSRYIQELPTVTLTGDVYGVGVQEITVTLNTVPIEKGGTGQTTAEEAINALLPSQTNNENKVLSTNGTGVFWTDSFTLPIATKTVVGGIKVGNGLAVDETGTLSTTNVVSSGNFETEGDCQSRQYMLYGITSNTNPTELLIGGVDRMVLLDNSSWGFEVLVTGRTTNGSRHNGTWKFLGNIDKAMGNNTIKMSAVVPKDVVSLDDPSWNVTVSADATHGSLKVSVIGSNTDNIKWAASVHTVEIIG